MYIHVILSKSDLAPRTSFILATAYNRQHYLPLQMNVINTNTVYSDLFIYVLKIIAIVDALLVIVAVILNVANKAI